MRLLTSTIFASMILSVPAVAQGQGSGTPPLNGVIQSFDGKTIALKTVDGAMVTASFPPDTRIIFSVKKTLADIKPGDLVASAGTRGPDGKIHANEIRILPVLASEGQFAMARPGEVMTNASVKEVTTDATVKQVGSSSGVPVIRLTFHGAGAPGAANCTGRAADAPGGAGTGCVGETEFDVPADTPVSASDPGNPSMLKPGVKATINVAKAADGTMSATRVTLSQ